MMDLTFAVDDLELDDIVVTSMRDSVGLPESAASSGFASNAALPPQSCNSCSSGSSTCCSG
jgi:hypothetical protein